MWKKPGQAVPIDPSQVVVGMYVWLDVSWDDHPFLTSRVMVKTAKDVAIIHAHNPVGKLYYYPDRSTAEPLPLNPAQPDTAPVSEAEAAKATAEHDALMRDMVELETKKREVQAEQRRAAQRADKAWEDAARATRDALLNLTRSPKVAGEQLANLSRDTAASIFKSEEVLLHLLGDKKGQGPQFHALNTMTLSMLLGKHAGLTERELSDLAMASLAHDVGKAEIPVQILQTSNRKKFQEDFFRQHVEFSVRLTAQSGAFSKEALAIVADHHEAVDGSGWPSGKKDAGRPARILSIVDRYDRLCTPEATDLQPLMPSEALATMFKFESSRFDATLLSMLVRLLGVYPPGTVVQLSDGTLALVIAPGGHSLQPKILIYSPESTKEQAPTLDLASAKELKISEAIRPSTLPPDVLDWLRPSERLSYYFSVSPP